MDSEGFKRALDKEAEQVFEPEKIYYNAKGTVLGTVDMPYPRRRGITRRLHIASIAGILSKDGRLGRLTCFAEVNKTHLEMSLLQCGHLLSSECEEANGVRTWNIIHSLGELVIAERVGDSTLRGYPIAESPDRDVPGRLSVIQLFRS